MGYTKRQFITDAFNEIGIRDYVFDLSVDDINALARRLDAMIAEWNGRGIRIGYTIASSSDEINLDADTNVPDWTWEAIVTNLAIRLAPMVGKQVHQSTKVAAKQAYTTMLTRCIKPSEIPLPSMPAGAGAKAEYTYDEWTQGPIDSLWIGTDSELEV